jgi:hypothetical protein
MHAMVEDVSDVRTKSSQSAVVADAPDFFICGMCFASAVGPLSIPHTLEEVLLMACSAVDPRSASVRPIVRCWQLDAVTRKNAPVVVV